MIHLIIGAVLLVGTLYFVINIIVLVCRVAWLCVVLLIECLLVCVIVVIIDVQKLMQLIDQWERRNEPEIIAARTARTTLERFEWGRSIQGPARGGWSFGVSARSSAISLANVRREARRA
jgi:hypothetical protein